MADFTQWQLHVCGSKADQVAEIFERAGALSITVSGADDQEIFDVVSPQPDAPQNFWNKQILSAIFERPPADDILRDCLTDVLGAPPQLTIVEIEDQDWENKWKQGLVPFKVGNRLWICPTPCTPVAADETNIMIDPGMAFGTGNHETTALCLQRISEINVQGARIIDFGCGTGILGIAAGKLGAGRVIGVDIDPVAVGVARANVENNGVSEIVSVYHNDEIDLLADNMKSDLVIANILFNTIMELKFNLLHLCNSGAELLLSGILDTQCDAVIERYQDCFTFEKRCANNWTLLIGAAV